jgi:hypothetical protein
LSRRIDFWDISGRSGSAGAAGPRRVATLGAPLHGAGGLMIR